MRTKQRRWHNNKSKGVYHQSIHPFLRMGPEAKKVIWGEEDRAANPTGLFRIKKRACWNTSWTNYRCCKAER